MVIIDLEDKTILCFYNSLQSLNYNFKLKSYAKKITMYHSNLI
jgi:hypothetical protein